MNQIQFQGNQKSFPLLRNLKKGECLFSQGDEFRGYYLVKSGLIKTQRSHESGSKSILSIKTQGEFLGEYSTDARGKLHAYFASALEENTLVELIPIEDDGHLKLQKILETMQSEIQTARIRLEKILFQNAEERIKDALKELGKKLGKRFGDETLLKISLTHDDLARLADTSRQTVSTVLFGLKSQNKINYSRGRILFRNIDNF
jgi:CRP/FNR family transcriptional regulator, cyclic AMP receptor protein